MLPKSDFAEALRYIRNHWKELNVYVRDGRIPIDNNSVEQLMKQVAMGRKAWLFVCGVAGGEQSAMMMTLVSSARRHDLDVGVYVKDVLDQLLAGCTDYDRLLPDVWKQSHPEAIREYRVEERRDKADRKQFQAARRRLAARDLRVAALSPFRNEEQGKGCDPEFTGGQTTAGGLELLAFGFVTPLLDPVLADRFRMALLPDVGQQAVVVGATGQQLVQHVFDVDPDVQVVPTALLTSVSIIALCSPPATLQTNSHALRPIATCFINCSTELLSIGIRPSRT